MSREKKEYHKVIEFWFDECDTKQWWSKDLDFDQLVAGRFGGLHSRAVLCELVSWRRDPLGRFAEVIVLDQFSRNIYRDQPEAFASDPLALCLAQEAIEHGVETSLHKAQLPFLYMPFMHSESRVIHETAVGLFSKNRLESTLDFELKHKRIIDEFGRYPHRNKILGRESTLEELQFLEQPGSSF
ncbi:DUF924 family protein [Pseudomonadota bacterium]